MPQQADTYFGSNKDGLKALKIEVVKKTKYDFINSKKLLSPRWQVKKIINGRYTFVWLAKKVTGHNCFYLEPSSTDRFTKN